MINCLTPISNLNRLNYESYLRLYFPGFNTQLQRFSILMDFRLKYVSRSLSHSVCAFRAYGLKISTTDESVYLYISVYLNVPSFFVESYTGRVDFSIVYIIVK